MTPIIEEMVQAKFNSYPPEAEKRLLELRELIFTV